MKTATAESKSGQDKDANVQAGGKEGGKEGKKKKKKKKKKS